MEPGVTSGTSSATPSEVTPATSSSDKDPYLLDSDDASNSRTQVSYMPIINEQLSDGSAKESLSTMVMDRAGESPLPDPNRIPPHVFDRTKSTTQVDWSVASNESLFSLHMGNMSFNNEQLNWMNKSGELGLIGDGHFSGDIPYISAPPLPPVNESHESSVKDGNLIQKFGAIEASAAEKMRELVRENASDHNNQEKLPPPKAVSPRKADPRALPAKSSDDSRIKSFAFPILTGDGNKSKSMSVNQGNKKKKQHSQPSTPKTTTEPETPEAKPKATNKKAWQGKWFSCCPFCS